MSHPNVGIDHPSDFQGKTIFSLILEECPSGVLLKINMTYPMIS